LAATNADVAVLGTGISPPKTRPSAALSRDRADLSDVPQCGQTEAFRSIRARHAEHIRCDVSKDGSFGPNTERMDDFSFSSLNRSRGESSIGFRKNQWLVACGTQSRQQSAISKRSPIECLLRADG